MSSKFFAFLVLVSIMLTSCASNSQSTQPQTFVSPTSDVPTAVQESPAVPAEVMQPTKVTAYPLFGTEFSAFVAEGWTVSELPECRYGWTVNGILLALHESKCQQASKPISSSIKIIKGTYHFDDTTCTLERGNTLPILPGEFDTNNDSILLQCPAGKTAQIQFIKK